LSTDAYTPTQKQQHSAAQQQLQSLQQHKTQDVDHDECCQALFADGLQEASTSLAIEKCCCSSDSDNSIYDGSVDEECRTIQGARE
jgi:hypothetical protein